jgi:mono/diheme cytochrome c family protein
MKIIIAKTALVAVGVVLCSSALFAQQNKATDLGKREFDNNCASCHGVDGKGNGPMGEFLRRSAPDLTQLAKKNGGVLPMGRMYDVIEGAGVPVPSHGVRDMPVWGREYRIEEAQNLMEARGNYDAAALVRGRILMLLEYINRIQVR